ncbi:MAG: DegT/DnrJ/EryC1/StrS family aminotransferase [Elusimicrobia bacterium]|nr:DegT/DnrJ/EryC1/StrS family aminotransferase [Elusimicrobiota bacterium]
MTTGPRNAPGTAVRKPGIPVRPDYLPFGKPSFSSAEVREVSKILRSGWIGMGPQVIAFEGELAAFTGARHVVAVNSCTSALFLSLLLHRVGPGDEVVVPSLTWCSTANAALYAGAKPVFCDIAAGTLCATPETVLAKVTRRTKAVIVVHYGGKTVDVRALRAALPRRVALIEDAAHALGSRYPDGGSVGSSGNLTAFSFYANKNLSTAEGGAIALPDAALAERGRSLRLHGLPVDAWKRFSQPKAGFLWAPVAELGYKMNYTDLQACLGRVQLRRQPEFSRRRLAIARHYAAELVRLEPAWNLPEGQTDPSHARHLFVVRCPSGLRLSRDEFFMELRHRNVGVSLHYTPLHMMPFYKRLGGGRLPNTEAARREIMTLPISASMTLRDAAYVTDHIREVAERCRA